MQKFKEQGMIFRYKNQNMFDESNTTGGIPGPSGFSLPSDLHAMMGIGDRHHANTGRDLETLVPKGGNKIAEKGAQEVNMKYQQSDLAIDDILEAALELGASDIHLSAGERLAFRISGKIYFVDNYPSIPDDMAEKLIFSLVSSEEQKETLLRTKELDTAYEHKDGTNFRVNIFYKRKSLSTVLRIIASEAFEMGELGLPAGVENLITQKQGLLLVTGPTGSGKSTSMQSMIEHINKGRVEHIITIEDPIEFIFKSKKSIISQREVGADTLSFANALRATLREDPDIVMIGEMRDPETIMAAINLSETGHLVISTLHTSGVPQTISRMINAFPTDQHNMIQNRLADCIIGILGQRLIPRADRKGRVGIYELMIATPGIRHLIRSGSTTQIKNAMQSGREHGMVRMEQYAEVLSERGIIHERDYEHYFQDE
ncbi:PilT/PilU family type 4a pilus ATPase [Candidatus Peregrinibacteria bacterium]|nr:MAG: PilT/PilU family type 4a pilus ATPase [Candidatus Peregrinibacteria bacterium]